MTKNSNPHEKGHFFRGMIWSSGANLLAMAASLATIMVATRILAKGDMGAYFLIMIIVQVAVSLGDIGLGNAAIRFLSKAENSEIIDISRYLLTVNSLASGLACLILALIVPFIVKLWPSLMLEEVVWYSIPIVFLTINFQMGLSLLAGHKLFSSMSLITVSIETVRMATSISALYLGYGVVGLLMSMVLSRVIGIGLIWRKLHYCLRPTLKHGGGGEILKFSSWMYGVSLMSVFNAKMAEVVVTHYMGTAALAGYSTAMQIPIMLQKIFDSIRPVVLGYISSLKLEAAHASIAGTRLLTGLLTISAAFLIAFAHPLVTLLFSSRYEDSVPIMQVLSAWMAIGISNYYLSITLIAMGDSRKVFILLIPQFFVMLVCSLLLIPIYQGIGAAFALIIMALVGNVLSCWMVARRDMSLFGALNRASFRSIIPLLLLLIIVLLMKTAFAQTIILSLATIGMLLLLRAVTWGDVTSISRRIFHKS